jgi:hypothetical protein
MRIFRVDQNWVLFGVLLLGGTATAWTQRTNQAPQVPSLNPQAPGIQDGPGSRPRNDMEMSPLAAGMEAQQAKARNSERQKRIQGDTEKLLALATELKQQIEKQDKNALPGDVAKKAEEIEKLAKSVKDRMKS